MAYLTDFLVQNRCPHCGADSPTLRAICDVRESRNHEGGDHRLWRMYACGRCGGVVTAGAKQISGRVFEISEIYPRQQTVDETVPERARNFLSQALDSLSAPDGAVMLAASAVDAMLKEKRLKNGSLYARIQEAKDQGTITADMEKWAHQVRLDATDPRHADDMTPHHDGPSAKRAVDFALALAQFLFVLPARVTRGIEDASKAAIPEST